MIENNETKERLLQIISESGLSKTEFAKRLGRNYALLSRYINGNANIGLKFLTLLRNAGFDDEYVRTGNRKSEAAQGNENLLPAKARIIYKMLEEAGRADVKVVTEMNEVYTSYLESKKIVELLKPKK